MIQKIFNNIWQLKMLVCIIVAPLSCYAHLTKWDKVRFDNLNEGQYTISSGTGFFVDAHFIVTNEHVVQHCASIAVRGSIEPTRAYLISSDKKLDLALLHVPTKAKDKPGLRLYKDIELDELVYAVGYPLDRAYSGKYTMRPAYVLGLIESGLENFNFVEFTDTVEQGHSGGPILDSKGGVVGVITSKITYKLGDEFYKVSRGIDIAALAWFLNHHKVKYRPSMEMEKGPSPSRYIVNIHCVKAA